MNSQIEKNKKNEVAEIKLGPWLSFARATIVGQENIIQRP